jgi:hypothetical protein
VISSTQPDELTGITKMEMLFLAVLELGRLSKSIEKNEKAAQPPAQRKEALAAIVVDAEKLKHVAEKILTEAIKAQS